jgi:hypothetical protein
MDRGFAIGSWRNVGTKGCVAQRSADRIGVVALVGEKIGWLLVSECDYIFERRTVCGFAGREMEDEWEALGITEAMNCTGEPAPRAAKSVFASPDFAPAAET